MGLNGQHILFGVDGGGSGCRVAVCDASGNRIGEVSGGPANMTSDHDQALFNVRNTIAKCAREFEISDAMMQSSIGHVGLAGVISKREVDAVSAVLPFAKAAVTDDRETALVGALGDRFGVLAAIGTGTIIAARSASGTRSFGGWGLQISDQASGAWLGQKAYRCCVLARDGLVEHSDLTRQLLASHNDDLVSMVAFARDATPQDYAKAARLVVDCARTGDANAVRLMLNGVSYLNDCLDIAELGEGDVVCLSGGVGPHYKDFLHARFRHHIRPPLGTALDGALHLAKQYSDTLREAQ